MTLKVWAVRTAKSNEINKSNMLLFSYFEINFRKFQVVPLLGVLVLWHRCISASSWLIHRHQDMWTKRISKYHPHTIINDNKHIQLCLHCLSHVHCIHLHLYLADGFNQNHLVLHFYQSRYAPVSRVQKLYPLWLQIQPCNNAKCLWNKLWIYQNTQVQLNCNGPRKHMIENRVFLLT